MTPQPQPSLQPNQIEVQLAQKQQIPTEQIQPAQVGRQLQPQIEQMQPQIPQIFQIPARIQMQQQQQQQIFKMPAQIQMQQKQQPQMQQNQHTQLFQMPIQMQEQQQQQQILCIVGEDGTMHPLANDERMVLENHDENAAIDDIEEPLSHTGLLCTIIDNQLKIFKKLEFLEKQIDCFIASGPSPAAAANIAPIPVAPVFSRIDSIDDLKEFEEQLKSDEFVQFSVSQYKNVF